VVLPKGFVAIGGKPCSVISSNEKKLIDLTTLRQRHNETPMEFLRRFRETKSMCFSLNLPIEVGESSKPRVTSRILLNKWQRQQEKERYQKQKYEEEKQIYEKEVHRREREEHV
jgi:hypothetical protein